MLTKYIDYENPRYIHNKVVNYFISKVIDGGMWDKSLWEWLREDTREINLNPRKTTAKPIEVRDIEMEKLEFLIGTGRPLEGDFAKEWDEGIAKANDRILKRDLDYDE